MLQIRVLYHCIFTYRKQRHSQTCFKSLHVLFFIAMVFMDCFSLRLNFQHHKGGKWDQNSIAGRSQSDNYGKKVQGKGIHYYFWGSLNASVLGDYLHDTYRRICILLIMIILLLVCICLLWYGPAE